MTIDTSERDLERRFGAAVTRPVPFAADDTQFVDDVRVTGNVLHRLRVPRRAAEAGGLVDAGVKIEGYDRLAEVAHWIAAYRQGAGATA